MNTKSIITKCKNLSTFKKICCVVGVLFLIGIFMPKESIPETPVAQEIQKELSFEDKIKSLDKNITTVSQIENNISITLNSTYNKNADDLIYSAFNSARRIINSNEFKSKEIQEVKFVITTSFENDKNGNVMIFTIQNNNFNGLTNKNFESRLKDVWYHPSLNK